MSLSGKLVSQTEIKSDGNVFHEIFKDRPHHLANTSRDKVQGCQLHNGAWGSVGSVIFWNYTHDGKEKVAKEIIEAIDSENKSITFKVIEGDLMELYKTFIITVHVDTSGQNSLVTLTIDYEKLNQNVPDPNQEMEFLFNLAKDIETHHPK